jgi:hypothetical protein
MTILVSINISFNAENPEEVQAVVDALDLPLGAMVNVSSTENLFSGVVNTQGAIVDPTAANLEELSEPEPEPEPDA